MLRSFGRIFIIREAAEITRTMVVAESKVALMLSGSPVIVRRVLLNQAREIGTVKVRRQRQMCRKPDGSKEEEPYQGEIP